MKNYPEVIPVFPLSGVIYFPNTNLPLNIFEQRYLDLVNDAYKKDKLMGMVQSKNINNSVYSVGCLGKISDYQKSKDGRIILNLTGIIRFHILDEVVNDKLYREFKVNYKNFEEDLFNWDVDAYSSALKDNTTYSIESSLRMFSDKTVGYRWWHSAEWVQQISLTCNRKKKEKLNFIIYIYIYMMKKLL